MKNDKRQKPKAETTGFTIVEIVAVLVLLGILAAVAVPKFFDLSSDAEKKVAEAALMEAQVRINAGYSKAVYAGSTCEAAVKKVNTLALIGDAGTNKIGKFEFKLESGDEIAAAPGTYVTLTATDSKREYEKLGQLFVPTCDENGDSGDSSKPESGLTCPDTSKPQTCSKTTITCSSGTCNCSCTCNADGSTLCTCENNGDSGTTNPDNPVYPDDPAGMCSNKGNFKTVQLNILVSGCLGQDVPKANIKYSHGSMIQIEGKFYVIPIDVALGLNDGPATGGYENIPFWARDSFILVDENNILTYENGKWSDTVKKGSLFIKSDGIYVFGFDLSSDTNDRPEWVSPTDGRWVKIQRKRIKEFDMVKIDNNNLPNHCWYDDATGEGVCQ